MKDSPFGINVVSRSTVVVCRGCGARAQRVGSTCETCGADLAEGQFAIATTKPTARERLLRRLHLRRAPTA